MLIYTVCSVDFQICAYGLPNQLLMEMLSGYLKFQKFWREFHEDSGIDFRLFRNLLY